MLARPSAVLLSCLCACPLLLAAYPASAAPWDKPGWSVTFHDEFDKGEVDTTLWKKRYKWGEAVINSELQAYVDDAFAFQGDVLRIVGEHKSGQYAGKTLDYTSGVISSVHEQKFGFFEIRCRMPKGKGLWPAFWLLGKVGAEGVNEIDIHEFLGHEVNKVYMTIHWGPSYGDGHEAAHDSLTGPDFTADFHTFAVEWETDHVTWYIDGVEQFTHTGQGVPQVEMYAIANLAIGGGWPGTPDTTTAFPAYYDVDYIRIYERAAQDAGTADAEGQDAPVDVSPTPEAAQPDAWQGDEAAVEAAGPDGVGSDGAAADGASDAAAATPQFPPSDDGGCGCRAAGRASTSAGWLALLGLALLGRARRSRR